MALTNSLGMEFVRIPGKNYYMGKYTVTQKEWKAVMGTTPWNVEIRMRSQVKEGDDHPATCISWNDCREFGEKLNRKEDTDKYRLPTEKEWEYACRAGSTTKYCFGNDAKRLGEYAWYDKNADEDFGECPHANDAGSQRVGLRNPNNWGLYDMHGNTGNGVRICMTGIETYVPLGAVAGTAPPISARRRTVSGAGPATATIPSAFALRSKYPNLPKVLRHLLEVPRRLKH